MCHMISRSTKEIHDTYCHIPSKEMEGERYCICNHMRTNLIVKISPFQEVQFDWNVHTTCITFLGNRNQWGRSVYKLDFPQCDERHQASRNPSVCLNELDNVAHCWTELCTLHWAAPESALLYSSRWIVAKTMRLYGLTAVDSFFWHVNVHNHES
jgi:hypothetical protein